MSDRQAGTCLCGAVAFSYSGAPAFVADCVCESCRRAHGASAVCWVGVKSEHFSLDRGETALCWYRSSAPSERGYCRECGTRLFFRSDLWPGETHMAVACLTEPHGLRSNKVSFRHEMPAWTALELAPKHESGQVP